MTLQLFDEHTPWGQVLVFTPDITPGSLPIANPLMTYRIDQLYVTSTDAIDHAVTVSFFDGSTDGPLVTVNVPAGAGTSVGVPAVDVITAISASLTGLVLTSYYQIDLNVLDAVSAGKVLSATAIGGRV